MSAPLERGSVLGASAFETVKRVVEDIEAVRSGLSV